MTKFEQCIADLLISGSDDWVQAAEVVSIIVDRLGTLSEDYIKKESLKLISHVILNELMEAGDVDVGGEWTSDEKFRKWSLSPQACIDKIDKEWRKSDKSPNLWEVCWLNNTEKGELLAQEFMRK